MRAIVSAVLFGSALLYAGFFPKTTVTTVTDVDGKTIHLKHALGSVGTSGAVLHSFRGIEALTGYVVQSDKQHEATLTLKTVIEHDKLPGIKTPPQKGDKIVGGYLYNNVMALVPDAETYAKTVSAYPYKTWFHPDLLAAFLSSEGEAIPTPALLRKFAAMYQVGLFYIVKKDEAVLYDPISQHVVAHKPFKGTVKEAKFPFYMRFEKFRTGIFSDSSEENGNYYDIMERFQ